MLVIVMLIGMVSYPCCFTTGVEVMERDNIITFTVLCVFYAWTPGVDTKMVRYNPILSAFEYERESD